DGAIVQPLPLQENGIPLWIAGGGEKKTLRIAAKYAQYTNFSGAPDEFAAKSDILRAHCADVGTDFAAIVRSSNFNAIIASTETEVEERLSAVQAKLATVIGDDQAKGFVDGMFRTSAAVGTPEQVAERLAGLRDLGLGYAILNFPEAAYDTSGIALFEREVAPTLA
ncbi:LLM class flavin-dependent oxidoreductase, partial [Nocardia brasiliensis]